MWIVKRSRFDEIFASAVSDRPSEQRFKKSNFGQLRSLSKSDLNFNFVFLGITEKLRSMSRGLCCRLAKPKCPPSSPLPWIASSTRRKPHRVCANLVRRRGSSMRSRQALETHLNGRRDYLMGRRKLISARTSVGGNPHQLDRWSQGVTKQCCWFRPGHCSRSTIVKYCLSEIL
jgi:hypothetical protein